MVLRSGFLITGMVLGSLAIWTASPALWLWIASQMEGGGPPTMGAIAVVVIGVAATTIALGKGLAVLHARWRELHGQKATIRVHLAWLRSLRGERNTDRPRETGADVHLSLLDIILVISVLVAITLYNVWFLFYADSPIDFRSGRD
jgi:hypothetical protein